VIAIDLGSNTLRVVEYDCISRRTTASFEKIVKTADKLSSTGVIDHTAVERVIYAIKEAEDMIDFKGQEIVAVTTEAVRQAENAEDVLRRIKEETGISFHVISGEEEAGLTLLAVRERLHRLHLDAERFVLIDIGGGSTEVIFHYPEGTISKSFPIGIVTIAQTYGDLDTIAQALPEEMLSIQMFAAETYATKGEVEALVATAGTPTTVAAMKLGQTYATYDAARINGTILYQNELTIYLEKLLSLPLEAREVMVGTGRSDLIAAGILIFKQLCTVLEFETCIVVDDGLREGVALQWCKAHHK